MQRPANARCNCERVRLENSIEIGLEHVILKELYIALADTLRQLLFLLCGFLPQQRQQCIRGIQQSETCWKNWQKQSQNTFSYSPQETSESTNCRKDFLPLPK